MSRKNSNLLTVAFSICWLKRGLCTDKADVTKGYRRLHIQANFNSGTSWHSKICSLNKIETGLTQGSHQGQQTAGGKKIALPFWPTLQTRKAKRSIYVLLLSRKQQHVAVAGRQQAWLPAALPGSSLLLPMAGTSKSSAASCPRSAVLPAPRASGGTQRFSSHVQLLPIFPGTDK